MPRPLLFGVATLMLHIVSAHADDTGNFAVLKAAMDRLGEAFVSEDIAAIKKLVTTDHVAIGPTYDGPVTIDEQIALFARINLEEWVATTPEITMLSEAVAMSMFGISMRGTMDGAPLHSHAYATEVWVKRDGDWLQRLYQETAIGER